MTVGIAILLLWLSRIVIKQVCSLEKRAVSSGCFTLILGLVYMAATIWMIVRFWNVPW